MLNRSPYRRRYVFAVVYAVLLTLTSVFIPLDAFVFAKAQEPLMPIASITFTPVPAPPAATPIQRIYTDTEYTDENISIHVTKVEQTDLVYYVADVKLTSAQYFKTAFANDTFGRNQREDTSKQAARHNAILAINGDYYGYRDTGLIIRNGTLYRDNPTGESLVLMQNGEMHIVGTDVSGESLIAQGALQSWSYGPTLVESGAYVQRSSRVSGLNPRTGIGMIEPLHYIFICVDGRRANGSLGLKMQDFAQLFVDLGCTVAYNLDGGGSSTMVMNDKLVNSPCYGEERSISDIIYIGLD